MLPAFDGDGLFVTIAPSLQASLLPARTVFSGTIKPILSAIGFVNPDEARKKFYVPDHNGVPMARTNVEGLLRIRCEELMVRPHESGVTALCGSLKKAFAGDDNAPFSKEIAFHTGKTVQDYSQTLSTMELEYFFPQIHSLTAAERLIPNAPAVVPIEHTGLRATAWEGNTVNSVTGRVFLRYKTANRVTISPADIEKVACLALEKQKIECGSKPILPIMADVVLIPYGKIRDAIANEDIAGMRFAYRVQVEAKVQIDGQPRNGVFYLWLDAEDKTGQVLQLVPFTNAATATGEMIVRDPSTITAYPSAIYPTVDFPIDDPSGTPSIYTLRLSRKFYRLDRYPSQGSPDPEVAALTSVFSNPAVPVFREWLDTLTTLANNPLNYQCVYDQTTLYPGIFYEQIDLMATLTRRVQEALTTGGLLSPPDFPGGYPITVKFNNSIGGCYGVAGGGYIAGFDLTFGLCKRPSGVTCPVATPGTNPIHDHTIVSHELGHLLTWHQYRYDPLVPLPKRDPNWCDPTNIRQPLGTPSTCPKPEDPDTLFHDFADAWANHFEDTNCVGGWAAKDEGGADTRKNCLKHDEGDGLPRLSKVSAPNVIDAGSKDSFPAHRALKTGAYANMQIAAAALWATREGIRSHLGPALGPAEYFRGFVHTLQSTGWLGSGYSTREDDLNVYRGLLDLEVKLANEWVKPTASTTRFLLSKITAGFARAGLFMIPPTCIDGKPSTTLPHYCPSGEDGGDAVIDIDDNDPANDERVFDVTHQNVDYLKRSGSEPTFLIWTGPTYTFYNASTNTTPVMTATTASPPCNTEYKVEAATDAAFTTNLVTGGWESLPTTGAKCFKWWPLNSAQWNALKGSSGETRVYYRVKTRKNSGAAELSSTSPAKGLFDVFGAVPPSYAVVNDTGISVYPPPPPVTDITPPIVPTGLRVD